MYESNSLESAKQDSKNNLKEKIESRQFLLILMSNYYNCKRFHFHE